MGLKWDKSVIMVQIIDFIMYSSKPLSEGVVGVCVLKIRIYSYLSFQHFWNTISILIQYNSPIY